MGKRHAAASTVFSGAAGARRNIGRKPAQHIVPPKRTKGRGKVKADIY
jgi:hypothetical protein